MLHVARLDIDNRTDVRQLSNGGWRGCGGTRAPSRAPWVPGVPGMSGERVGRLSVGCGGGRGDPARPRPTMGPRSESGRTKKGVVGGRPRAGFKPAPTRGSRCECSGVRMALEAEPRLSPSSSPPWVPDRSPARRFTPVYPAEAGIRGWAGYGRGFQCVAMRATQIPRLRSE